MVANRSWNFQTETAFSSHHAVGEGVKILFESHLGPADFHLPNKSCVLYLSERDVIAGNGYKRKVVRYRNVSFNYNVFSYCSIAWETTNCARPLFKVSGSFQELVLVENSQLCQQYFSSVQKFVTFDLGLTLLPVRGQNEASQLIAQMVNHKHKPDQKITFVWLKRQETQVLSIHTRFMSQSFILLQNVHVKSL